MPVQFRLGKMGNQRMSERRPLLNARVDRLEGLFREKRHDAQTLRRIAAELLHRDSSRANSLLIKVKARLDEAERDTRLPETEVSQAPKHPPIDDYVADVFGEVSPVGRLEERNGPDLFSASGSVKRKRFSAKTGQNPSQRTAREGAQWLSDIGELFGTSELNLHTVVIFLRAAHADRLGQPLESWELARLIGKASSTVSRNLGVLGDWSRKRQPGMGLITAQPDAMDRRRKPIRLTPKGRQLLRMIEDM